MAGCWAGLALDDRPRLMGIVNVTPDSFSDGGHYLDPGRAVEHGLALAEAGADILDVGGESTRPGAAAIDPAEESPRVVPVIRRLAEAGHTVSVDTRNAATMRAALDAGAAIVNDVTALEGDPGALEAVAAARAAVVLMHMRGEPATMQAAPAYGDVVAEVRGYLARRVEACLAAGIESARIAIDPGIGFGKTVEHNLALLRAIPDLARLGHPVLIGVSRKSTIARLSRGEPADERLGGSIAAALFAAARGAAILRVHDVAETAQALAVWGALEPWRTAHAGEITD